jgi:FkbM family methyltransferase
MAIQRHVKSLADAILRSFGLQLTRIDLYADRKWFYPTVYTCQIPTLSHLLELFLGRRTAGMFVEIGAFDGVSYSNTWGLAERGWDGLLVEPVPELATKCRNNHRLHPRVRILEKAVGANPGVISLVLAGELTTANHAQANEYRATAWARPLVTDTSVEVPMTTLDSLLEENNVPIEFDLLVVDVEGYESAVFKGFDLTRWLPKMLIVELADTHPDLSLTANNDARLSTVIQAAGYRIVYKDSINTVFVHQKSFSATYACA